MAKIPGFKALVPKVLGKIKTAEESKGSAKFQELLGASKRDRYRKVRVRDPEKQTRLGRSVEAALKQIIENPDDPAMLTDLARSIDKAGWLKDPQASEARAKEILDGFLRLHVGMKTLPDKGRGGAGTVARLFDKAGYAKDTSRLKDPGKTADMASEVPMSQQTKSGSMQRISAVEAVRKAIERLHEGKEGLDVRKLFAHLTQSEQAALGDPKLKQILAQFGANSAYLPDFADRTERQLAQAGKRGSQARRSSKSPTFDEDNFYQIVERAEKRMKRGGDVAAGGDPSELAALLEQFPELRGAEREAMQQLRAEGKATGAVTGTLSRPARSTKPPTKADLKARRSEAFASAMPDENSQLVKLLTLLTEQRGPADKRFPPRVMGGPGGQATTLPQHGLMMDKKKNPLAVLLKGIMGRKGGKAIVETEAGKQLNVPVDQIAVKRRTVGQHIVRSKAMGGEGGTAHRNPDVLGGLNMEAHGSGAGGGRPEGWMPTVGEKTPANLNVRTGKPVVEKGKFKGYQPGGIERPRELHEDRRRLMANRNILATKLQSGGLPPAVQAKLEALLAKADQQLAGE